MTLSVTNLGHNKDDTDTTSYATPSIVPVVGTLILVWVYSVDSQGGTHPIPTISGCGITWTQQQALTSAAFIGSIGALFSGPVTPAASSGTIAVTFGAGVLGAITSVDQVASTYSVPFVQQSGIATVTATNPTLTLGATASPDSVVVGYAGKPNTPAYSVGGSYVQLANDSAGEARSSISEYWLNPTDGIIRVTGANHADNKTAGIEVREQADGWGMHR